LHDTLAVALGKASTGTTDGVATLLNSLETPSSTRFPRAVAQALGEIGPEARDAVPLLREMLRDEDTDARTAASESLIRIVGEMQSPAEKTPDPELPEQERKYLWEVEHHGNQLNKHGFNELAKALKAGDPAMLTRLLSDNFVGSDLRDPKRIHASGPVEVDRLEDAGHSSVALNREAFVSRLMQLRKQFHGDAQVKLALMTLSPVQRGKLDGPWQGKAQLRLVGEHKPGAPAEMVVVLTYEVPRPTPESLSKPGWLRAAGFKQILDGKAPSYLFVEQAKNRGLDASKLHDNWNSPAFQVSTGGVYVTDFDRDGILDVLITDFNGSALYRGTAKGVFENVTNRLGVPGEELPSRVAVWIDIDADGWEDLIIGDRVFRNDLGTRFEDYTSRARIKLPVDITNMVVADYDRDGKLDVYMTRSARLRGRSWLEGKSSFSRGNVLLRNKGDWVFEDVTRLAGVSGDRRSTFTAAWLDANNDGWPDLHVINEFGDGVLLVNQKDGKFLPHKLANRPADFGTMGMAVGDVDNDGNIDIYCANMYSKAGTRVIGNLAQESFSPEIFEKMRRFVAGSQLHLNRGDLKFDQVGIQRQVAAVGWAYGAALADLDNDGFLDIYGTAGYVSRDRNEPDG
ncbi:MAG: FG-GAP-like repeat-containing protein, partial [Gemmataceae bacterium]